MKPFTLALHSDVVMNINLLDTAGNALLLDDVFDLVLTFVEKETGKRIARFRKTPGQNDSQIQEEDNQMFIRWTKAITEDFTPCTVMLQTTEIYSDNDFPGKHRYQTSEPIEAIWLVNNENADL